MTLPPLTPTARLRWDLVRRWLEEIESVETVLEVGAGLGSLGARLAQRYDYTGIEPDEESCRVARQRIVPLGGTILPGIVSDLPPGAHFDMICAFEVLEHIDDDLQALRDWRDRLEVDGWLVLSVPAFQRRFGRWDERAGHLRRYEPDQIADLLREVGLEVRRLRIYGWPLANATERIRHWIAGLRPVEDAFQERTARSARNLQPGLVMNPILAMVSLPFCWLQRHVGREKGVGMVIAAQRS